MVALATRPASPHWLKRRDRAAPMHLALSPLHALFTADPTRYGPYSPSTRLFLNPLHASPALVFGDAHVAQMIAERGLSETFAQLEALTLIDWPAAAAAKLG